MEAMGSYVLLLFVFVLGLLLLKKVTGCLLRIIIIFVMLVAFVALLYWLNIL